MRYTASVRQFFPAAVALLLVIVGIAASPPAVTFNSNRAFGDLRELVGLGPRPAGSPALKAARDYIRGQLAPLGLTVTEQPFKADTPLGPIAMSNVIVTVPGPHRDRIVFAGHYDTKLYRQFPFVGANDGGSSAAVLIELARVLKERRNPLTIELVFFDGEEATLPDWTGNDHTYGSRYYVEAAKKAGTLESLKALVLVDMIGQRDLQIRREDASTGWLTDLIWATAKSLGYGDVFVNQSLRVEDDHVPFLQAGVPAVDLIDMDYPPWHTAEDTLDKVSARSLQIVGDVLLGALPKIEARVEQGGQKKKQ